MQVWSFVWWISIFFFQFLTLISPSQVPGQFAVADRGPTSHEALMAHQAPFVHTVFLSKFQSSRVSTGCLFSAHQSVPRNEVFFAMPNFMKVEMYYCTGY